MSSDERWTSTGSPAARVLAGVIRTARWVASRYVPPSPNHASWVAAKPSAGAPPETG